MFAVRQIIENPQDMIAVPAEFRHRPIEIIFIALESEKPLTTETKKCRENWFDGYQIENDVDVLASLPVDEASEEWEW